MTDFNLLDPRNSIIWLPMDGVFRQDVGENLVTNGDFEAGLTGWSASNAILSLVGSAHSGVQCMRVTQDGTFVNARALISTTFATNMMVHAKCWAKGDGICRVRYYNVLGGFFFDGSAAVSPWPIMWSPIDAISTVASGTSDTALYSYIAPTTAGAYVDFDDVSIVEYPMVCRSLSRAQNYARLGNGQTASTFPTQLPRRGLSFDGVANGINLDFAAGGALDTQTFTFLVYLQAREQDLPDYSYVYEIGTVTQRYVLYFYKTDHTLRFLYYNAGSNPEIVSSDGYPDGQGHVYAITVGPLGIFIYVDGRLVVSTLTDIRMSSFLASSIAWIGRSNWGLGNTIKGKMYASSIYPFELTAAQVREWGRRAKQLRNI